LWGILARSRSIVGTDSYIGGNVAQDGMTVMVTGRWGKTPEVEKTEGGRTLLKGRLAVGSRVKVEGEWTNGPTLWLDVVDWQGDRLTGSKGDQVQIAGKLAWRQYTDKNGSTQTVLTVNAETCELLWSKSEPGQQLAGSSW